MTRPDDHKALRQRLLLYRTTRKPWPHTSSDSPRKSGLLPVTRLHIGIPLAASLVGTHLPDCERLRKDPGSVNSGSEGAVAESHDQPNLRCEVSRG